MLYCKSCNLFLIEFYFEAVDFFFKLRTFLKKNFFSPPFTAYNQKELAEKIREGKYRRIPYRYSEDLNTLLSRMLNLKVEILKLAFVAILMLSADVTPAWCLSGHIIVTLSHGVQDYLRPSVESILQSRLLADAVAEEKAAQVRLRRKSAESAPLGKPAEPTSMTAPELRLREQAVQEREKALKEREERLERKAFISAS